MDAATQNDLDLISKLTDRYDHNNSDNLKKISTYCQNKNPFRTSFGQRYLDRINSLISGNEVDKTCILCQKKPSTDGVFCPMCKKAIAQFSSAKSGTGALESSKNSSAATSQNVTSGEKNVSAQSIKRGVQGAMNTVTSKINTMAGGDGAVELRIRDLFSDVFKRHSVGESDKIFICGTSLTTPDRTNISAEWPHPWLYSRIFILFFVAFLLLSLGYVVFQNLNLLPGIIFTGSCFLPFAVLMFFFEVNAPRNISIFRTVQVFLIGGVFSLLVTLLLFLITPETGAGFLEAIFVGIVEEIGKLIVVGVYIKKIKGRRFILNGMLYGAAVGTGFAVFESAGYAMRYLSYGGFGEMMNVIIVRAILSPGGHIAWAAISGAALMIVLKQEDEFSWSVVKDPKFLRLFMIPVILHAVWDMPLPDIYLFNLIPVFEIILGIIAWVVVLVLLHRGLEEVNSIIRKP